MTHTEKGNKNGLVLNNLMEDYPLDFLKIYKTKI